MLSYDDANRLEAITHRAALHEVSAPVLNDYNFVYDDASRIQSIDSLLDGLSVFTFSTDNQLTDADHDPSRDDENYSYDANGNRIGGSYVVDTQNRTASDGTYDYEYDDEGNRTRRTLIADGSFEVNTFDHRNRLTKVEFYEMGDVVGQDDPYQSISYTYDAFNNLVRRTVDTDGNGTDDLDQIFAGFDRNQSTFEFDGSETSNLTHRRLWGPLVDQLIASEEVDSLTTPGDVLWALFDQVGTIRDIGQFDPNAGTAGEYEIVSHRVYNSFGVLTDEYDPDTQSPSNVVLDFGFTGKFTDDLTGLTHHQHRWLDPQLGKWINEDPIGLAGGDVNTTRYVANDPLMYNDPTGLFASNMGSFGGLNGGSGDGIKAPDGPFGPINPPPPPPPGTPNFGEDYCRFLNPYGADAPNDHWLLNNGSEIGFGIAGAAVGTLGGGACGGFAGTLVVDLGAPLSVGFGTGGIVGGVSGHYLGGAVGGLGGGLGNDIGRIGGGLGGGIIGSGIGGGGLGEGGLAGDDLEFAVRQIGEMARRRGIR